MHFHLQIPHRTTTRHSKYNVNSIVRLLLKLCPPQKIRVNIPTSRICWWQKRKQSTTAFCSIKTKAFFFKKRHVVFNKTIRHFQQNNTLFSTKRHVTFNKGHLLLNAHLKMAHIKHLVIKLKKTNYFLSTLAHTHAYAHT